MPPYTIVYFRVRGCCEARLADQLHPLPVQCHPCHLCHPVLPRAVREGAAGGSPGRHGE
uniref:Uncharacterized protein n=1 Tax=Rhinolophus ferrumequinum TaxID=59479 RepID=A0A671FE75_RHIFE